MTYDPETTTALASGALVLRDFLTVQGKTLGGGAATFAYWTGEDNIAVNVVPAGGETPQSRNFVGGGTLLSVPDVIDAIGLEARGVTFGLDQTSTVVGSPMDMVFGNNVRVARVELHRGVFDPATWNLVAAPHLLFAGRVDGAELNDAEAGGEGSLSLTAQASAIDLTKTNPAMESDEQQQLRSGDRFRRYGDTAGQVETWWGQARS
ncbi:hypothetical protein GCM10011321_14570 [Youhaiella tibetensis]|uniref:Uncharacterized protein n=1 Tax=Paradevosia tibetensis TaxID=1447062 RepID=A0A5B9DMU1_9HYPH|nr:hypothetical protein [Youhaiella tibetensis]QEE20423.1 hypothetical protein FNA67_09665 [Youhaiella tibetensis]GGF24288.1 hypothetical protein GCM10011321_14570 [Youhaiella tibetensis]